MRLKEEIRIQGLHSILTGDKEGRNETSGRTNDLFEGGRKGTCGKKISFGNLNGPYKNRWEI